MQGGEHCMLINKLVLSKLFYCSSVWSNAADTNLLKLQAVQNFAARIICVSRKFDHVLMLRFWKNCIGYLLYLRDFVLAFKYNQPLMSFWYNWLRSYLPLVDVSNTWWSKWSHDRKLPTSAYTLI